MDWIGLRSGRKPGGVRGDPGRGRFGPVTAPHYNFRRSGTIRAAAGTIDPLRICGWIGPNLLMLLSIDTSSRYGGAALSGSDGQVMEARLWRSTANHTAQLMPAVTELLTARGVRAAELTGVAVALGPGPFSALRVGVSAAKGLAIAGGFPIIGADTLLLEAWRYLDLRIYGQPSGPRGPVSWLDAGAQRGCGGGIRTRWPPLERRPGRPAGRPVATGRRGLVGDDLLRRGRVGAPGRDRRDLRKRFRMRRDAMDSRGPPLGAGGSGRPESE